MQKITTLLEKVRIGGYCSISLLLFLIDIFVLFQKYNPNEQDNSGFMPIHYAARGGKTEAVRVLLKFGANPNGRTKAGSTTPLHRAAFMGHLEIVQLLLNSGADSNSQDSDLATPLHKATQQNAAQVVEALLTAGADASLRDKNGKTAAELGASFAPSTT